MENSKTDKHPRIILDPVHGFIELSPIQDELLAQPELQRMRWVKQLGLIDLIFPGAHHSRIEHCLGSSFVSTKIAEQLKLEKNEKDLVQAAGLLHDIGHTPFSHVLEPMLPKDSMETTRDMIEGRTEIPLPNAGHIPEILEKYGIKPKDISDLICHAYKGKKYLQQIIFSEIDCDQIDYLARDSYYTGSTHGQIHVQRLLSIMRLVDNEICFVEKGLTEIEEFLVGREHMYTSIYLHHTGNAAAKMLLRAFESLQDKVPNFLYMTDAEVIAALLNGTKYTRDIMQRILYRRLFKRAFEISSRKFTKADIELVEKASKIGEKKLEAELTKKSGIPEGYLFVHLPANALSLSEPRMKNFNIKFVRKDNSTINVTEISTLVQALANRVTPKELFAVYTPPEYKEKAASAAKTMFS